MPIIELIVAVCMTAQPDTCSERRFAFVEPASPFSCMMQAVPYLAKWADDHPTWKIKTWRCDYANTSKRDA